jgi:hypothetical protein
LFALDPLGRIKHGSILDATARPPLQSEQPTVADRTRALCSTCVLAAWFAVQIHGDYLHLTGALDLLLQANPYWPLPEFSMFAKPIKGDMDMSRIHTALSITAGCALLFARKMLGIKYLESPRSTYPGLLSRGEES